MENNKKLLRRCVLCQNRHNYKTYKFFKTPLCDLKRQRWIDACGVSLKKSDLICQSHFTRQDFVNDPGCTSGKIRLQPGAVPMLLHATSMSETSSSADSNEETTDIRIQMNDEIEINPTTKQEITDVNDTIEILAKNQDMILFRLEDIAKRQDEMFKMINENNNLLMQVVECRNQKVTTRFPLKTEQDLEEINKVLQSDMRIEMVTMLKNILSIGGIQGNINKILSTDLILEYNVDGSKGKSSLKTYQAFMDALFEATIAEGRTQKEFYNDIRSALKTSKNRFHKQKWRLKQMEDPLAANDEQILS